MGTPSGSSPTVVVVVPSTVVEVVPLVVVVSPGALVVVSPGVDVVVVDVFLGQRVAGPGREIHRRTRARAVNRAQKARSGCHFVVVQHTLRESCRLALSIKGACSVCQGGCFAGS